MVKAQINFSSKVYQQHDIKFIKMIGQGNWSDVYLAYNLGTTEKYAVKVTPEVTLKQTPKLRQLLQAEKNILKYCKHPNIVSYIKDFNEDEHQFIVLEYCNGGDLGELLRNETKISESLAIKYMFQILNGFKGLHKVNAMHRDFKVQNVMLHDNCCKIVDLGFGKQLASLDQVTKTKLGSNFTMAPEVMKRQPYGIKADIWSIGVVFYQLLQGTFPFTGRNMEKILQQIQKNEIVFCKGESSEVMHFIKSCLVVDPEKRIGWKQIYEHPLFNKLSSNKIINNSSLLADVKEQNREYYAKNEEKNIKIGPIYKRLDTHDNHPHSEQSNLRKRAIQTAESKEAEERQQCQTKLQNVEVKMKKIKTRIKQIDKQQQNFCLRQFVVESTQKQEYKLRQQKNKEPTHFSFGPNTQQKEEVDENKPAKNKIFSKWKHVQQAEKQEEQPLEEQKYFKDRLTTTFHNYQSLLQDCYYVGWILSDRYTSAMAALPSINHASYIAILWKDSYMKLADLIESLQSKRNIFHQETIDLFFTKYREDYIKSYRGLLEQARKQFNTMVIEAKKKNINKMLEAQTTNIQQQSTQNKKSWAKYVCDVVNQYRLLLAKNMQSRNASHTQKYTSKYAQKLLIYWFCLSEFAKQYSNKFHPKHSSQYAANWWSLSKRVSFIIEQKFDFNKAKLNIERYVYRAQVPRQQNHHIREHQSVRKQETKKPPFKI